jgi:hypothetical protein
VVLGCAVDDEEARKVCDVRGVWRRLVEDDMFVL